MLRKNGWIPTLLMAGVVLCGCSMGNRSFVSERTQLAPGEAVQGFRFIRITEDGKAEFHSGAVESERHPRFAVAVGESFGLERQSRRRTVYTFTVEKTDPATQQADLLVQAETR